MPSPLYQTLPIAAAAAVVIITGLLVAVRPTAMQARAAWLAPALLCILFLGWSLFAVIREGPLGFWPVHTRDAWGNQVWFDLLLGVGSAFVALAPRARALGMRLVPWFILIGCTGSVGLLAMLSRYLFLANRPSRPGA